MSNPTERAPTVLSRGGAPERPDARPWEVVQGVAQQAAAVGGDPVCAVVVIGSHARGTATPASDIDLVLLVDSAERGPWAPTEAVAEAGRVRAALRQGSLTVDPYVRTIDQFAEARGVIGCPEYLAATEGVVAYVRPLRRRPAVRRSPDLVRCSNVQDWLKHAWATLARAEARAVAPMVRLIGDQAGQGSTGSPRNADSSTTMWGSVAPASRAVTAVTDQAAVLMWRAVQRAAVAVFVARQAPLPYKQDPPAVLLAKLTAVDPDVTGDGTLRTAILADARHVGASRRAITQVAVHLAREPALRPFIEALVTSPPPAAINACFNARGAPARSSTESHSIIDVTRPGSGRGRTG